MHCTQLLIDRGINANVMNKNQQKKFFKFFFLYYKGHTIVYFALRLISLFSDLDDGVKCAEILSSREMHEELAIFMRLSNMIRSGRNIEVVLS